MLSETGIFKTVQEYHLVSPISSRLFKSNFYKWFLEVISILLCFCKKPSSPPLLYTYPLGSGQRIHTNSVLTSIDGIWQLASFWHRNKLFLCWSCRFTKNPECIFSLISFSRMRGCCSAFQNFHYVYRMIHNLPFKINALFQHHLFPTTWRLCPYHVQNFHYFLESLSELPIYFSGLLIYARVAYGIKFWGSVIGLISGNTRLSSIFFFRIFLAIHIYFSTYSFASMCILLKYTFDLLIGIPMHKLT